MFRLERSWRRRPARKSEAKGDKRRSDGHTALRGKERRKSARRSRQEGSDQIETRYEVLPVGRLSIKRARRRKRLADESESPEATESSKEQQEHACGGRWCPARESPVRTKVCTRNGAKLPEKEPAAESARISPIDGLFSSYLRTVPAKREILTAKPLNCTKLTKARRAGNCRRVLKTHSIVVEDDRLLYPTDSSLRILRAGAGVDAEKPSRAAGPVGFLPGGGGQRRTRGAA